MKESNNVVVIGGGAAGMMAAGTAASLGAHVTLLEPNGKLGKKLFITGKGRCNVTNNCAGDEVLKNVTTNPRFLYGALAGFSPADAMAFFEEHGCQLKTERGNRVFPESDQAGSVIDALRRFLKETGVEIRWERALEIEAADGAVTGVRTQTGRLPADRVILATGGCSYPATGSTGDGYRLAGSLGHTIIEPRGSLVPLVEKGHTCGAMQGLALKNVEVKLLDAKGKCVFSEFGELLFTHFGLSGPVILSASCHMQRGKEGYRIVMDLKPALDEKTLDARLLRDFAEFQNKDLSNALVKLLPHSMIVPVICRAGLQPQQKVNELTKQERRALLETVKQFSVDIASCAPVEQAIVTSGGVKVSEVSPKTMESKLVRGLYFAGELLDVDAYTGGFNLQIAWATGVLPGRLPRRKDRSMGKYISVAIDGPAGAGKSTMAKRVAKELGYLYVDTGAIYRTVGYHMWLMGIGPKDADGIRRCLDDVNIEIRHEEDGVQHMILNGQDVTGEIRTPEMSRYASGVSARNACASTC